MKQHKWSEEEQKAFDTYVYPEEFYGNSPYDLQHNIKALKSYLEGYGYYVESALMDVLIKESTLRQELRLAKPIRHNSDVLVQALKARPEDPDQPETKFTGDAQHKLQDAGSADVLQHEHLTADQKAEAQAEVDKDKNQILKEVQDFKSDLQEEQYKQEAEAITVAKGNKQDHHFTSLLRQIVARDKTTGKISWFHTLEARKSYAAAYQKRLELGISVNPYVKVRS